MKGGLSLVPMEPTGSFLSLTRLKCQATGGTEEDVTTSITYVANAVEKGETITMMVHIVDNSYSKRAKGQPWAMFSHYNGDVYSSCDCAMKMLAKMAKLVNADPDCYDVEFDVDGRNLRYRWKNGDDDELERFVQIESREVK